MLDIGTIGTLLRQWYDIAREDGIRRAIWSTRRFLVKGVKLTLVNGRSWAIVRTIQGSKMLLNVHPVHGENIEKSLAMNGVRESGATEIFRKKLEEIKLHSNREVEVFDIGANIGYYALMEANILSDGGHVLAIEAVPENVERLCENICLNHYDNIDVMQIAAGNRNSETTISLSSDSNKHKPTNLTEETVDEQGTEIVEERQVDDIVDSIGLQKDVPTVIRIDVEGYETKVLRGMSSTFHSHEFIYMFIELHPGKIDSSAVISLLRTHQFSPEYVSYNGGETYKHVGSFDELNNIDTNAHLFLQKGSL